MPYSEIVLFPGHFNKLVVCQSHFFEIHCPNWISLSSYHFEAGARIPATIGYRLVAVDHEVTITTISQEATRATTRTMILKTKMLTHLWDLQTKIKTIIVIISKDWGTRVLPLRDHVTRSGVMAVTVAEKADSSRTSPLCKYLWSFTLHPIYCNANNNFSWINFFYY